MIYLLIFIIAYAIGSISGSITIVKKYFNEDIRGKGSGNAGTTNTLRIYGKKYAVITLFVDVFKGSISVLIATLLEPEYGIYIAGLAVVIGHCWPIFYRFKGGKGMATSFGVNLVFNPLLLLMQLIFFAIINVSTKIVSISSMLCTIFVLVYAFIFETKNTPFIIMLALNAVVLIYKHKENIVKIINGNENKINIVEKLFKR